MSAVVAEAFVGSEASKLVIVVLTVLATAAFVGVIAVVFGRRQATVERRLAGYEAVQPAAAGRRHGTAAVMTAPETSIVQHGVDFASRMGRRTGLLARVERTLEQGDLPLRAGELLFYVPTFAILAFLLFSVLFGVLAGLIAGILVGIVPVGVIQNGARARLSKFEAMLPSTLTLLASSLRAGFSLMQGLETVGQETAEPVRRELQRVFTEVRLGRPIEDALGEVAARMDSQDLAWTVMAIRIQREIGGNLAVLLDTVAHTMTQRERLRREVKSLTAEGRLSAVILSIFPPALALLIWLIRPEYIETLFDHAAGIIAVSFAVVLNIIGWFWLRRIIEIEA